ncbi:MAG: hypothetical protein RHS_0021 [Robinsoniella sp. RHS]|nr:MAG: hypothetical protein RHS_0021 [Robinsoniella sp. RHS]
MLEAFSGTGDAQIQELEEDKESEEIRKKKLPNYFQDRGIE